NLFEDVCSTLNRLTTHEAETILERIVNPKTVLRVTISHQSTSLVATITTHGNLFSVCRHAPEQQ
ncbi:hypothetical protein N0Y54_36980, partial [Nostoc punctiforme UO1]|uniref:hypothetical protein n=1 Tax=Nostoc punctiforme TaxID=272131 RepID=UPI0030A900F0